MTTATTTYGQLEGIQREGNLAFYGIPYAGPTSGPNRWKAPVPAEPWSGVRKATEPGMAAPQSGHPIPGFAASGSQHEDCLYLNVFTPALDEAKRPVLFWIHGGGFTHGSGSEALYDGGPLATRGDVVVVTINYRLGALGYLYLGQHLPESGLTANAGQLDQIAALGWVRDNIAAFGGDPGNVTIFGESAGAAAVGTLLTMPAAKGLFHRAILQSGTGRGTAIPHAAKVTEMLLKEMGIEEGNAAELLTAPVESIVEAQGAVAARARATMGLAFGPVIDGETLPTVPIDAIGTGVAANIPVIAGTNRDEIKLFAASTSRDEIDEKQLHTAVARSLPKASGPEVGKLITLFRHSRTAKGLPATNLDIQDAIETDARFRLNAIRLAETQVKHQEHTFLYLFTHESPARRGALGSCHALEMPFVFGTLSAPTQDRFAGTGPEVEALSAKMMDAWIYFSRTGRPCPPPFDDWPAYDAEKRTTMVFGPDGGLQEDPFGEERAAIASLV